MLETFPAFATLPPALRFSLRASGVVEMKMKFDKRRLARIGAVVVVALAAGHLVQTMATRKASPTAVAEAPSPRPASVVQLAGTNEPAAVPSIPKPALPAAALAATPQPASVVTLPVPPVPQPVVIADACPVTLDLMADPGAMIGVTLLAPCAPNARVVVQHGGLAITARTSLTGTMFLSIPALAADGAVEVIFADRPSVTADVALDDLTDLRRFAVQWQADDAFQLYGYEGGTAVSAASSGTVPLTGLSGASGFLTRLGDAGVENPLLAEVYTYPARTPANVVVEAAVTPATCGRELLGETLMSQAGKVTVTDLSLAMPECDAVGDFLVLKNLVPDLTLAAVN